MRSELWGRREEEIDSLLDQFEDGDPQKRRDAAQSLTWQFHPRTTPAYLQLLGDSDTGVLKTACYALGVRGEQRAIEPLTCLLEHPEEQVRAAAAKALGLVGDPRAVSPLARHARDASLHARLEVVAALGRLAGADNEAEKRLLAALDDDLQFIREVSLSWLLREADPIDRALMSPQLDAVMTIDPRERITNHAVTVAARKLGLDEDDVRRRYESVADRLDGKIRLEWR